MRHSLQLLATTLGLFALMALLFVRSEANTLQLTEENANAFVKQVVEQLKKLNGDVTPTDTAQAGANPDNEAQLDNIRTLIDRVGQLRAQLQVTVVPSYNAAADALSGLVNRYNTLCVPNIIFKEAVQQAAAAGACPMQ